MRHIEGQRQKAIETIPCNVQSRRVGRLRCAIEAAREVGVTVLIGRQAGDRVVGADRRGGDVVRRKVMRELGSVSV